MVINFETDFPALLWMQMHPDWHQAVDVCTYSGLYNGIQNEGYAEERFDVK